MTVRFLKGVNLKSGLVLYISNSDNKFRAIRTVRQGGGDCEIPAEAMRQKSGAALRTNEGL